MAHKKLAGIWALTLRLRTTGTQQRTLCNMSATGVKLCTREFWKSTGFRSSQTPHTTLQVIVLINSSSLPEVLISGCGYRVLNKVIGNRPFNLRWALCINIDSLKWFCTEATLWANTPAIKQRMIYKNLLMIYKRVNRFTKNEYCQLISFMLIMTKDCL